MKLKEMMYGSLFLVLIIVLCLGLFFLNGPRQIAVASSSQGIEDLSTVDFEDNVYELIPQWDSWEEKLYSPKELATAEAAVPYSQLDYKEVDYVTHRLYIKLAPTIHYGLSYNTSNFAMRMYIDGKVVSSGGTPSDTKSGTNPSVQKKITYFTPEKENTEIVVQVSNFVHEEGGMPPVLFIGGESSIVKYERTSNVKQGIVFGVLITTSLIYLSVFLLNRKQTSSLLFSILCFFLSLASGNFFELYINDWVLSMRLEYLNYIGSAVVLVFFVIQLFPNTLYKYTSYFYLFSCIVFSIIILFSEPLFFSSLRTGFQLISIIMILQSLFVLVFANKDWSFKKVFALLGIFLFSTFIIIDILIRNGVSELYFFVGKTFNSAMGMVLLVFCYMMVLSVEQREINIRVEKLDLALGSAEKNYHELISQQPKIVPQDQLSNAGLSKREKEIMLLLIDGKSREEIIKLLHISLGTVNTHCSHIYQKTGCNKVVDLINKLKSS